MHFFKERNPSYKISNIIISRFQVKKILISIPGNEFLSWGTPHLPDAIIIGCRDGCTNEKHDNAVPAVCCICQLLTVLDLHIENRNQNSFKNIVDDAGAMIKRHSPEAF